MPDNLPDAGAAPVPAPVPTPTPLFVVYTRCTENDVENDYDGGRIVLTRVAGQAPEIRETVIGCNLVLSVARDAWMRQFPVTREEKQARFFAIIVTEVGLDQLPPDPNAEPELFNRAGARVDRNGNLVR